MRAVRALLLALCAAFLSLAAAPRAEALCVLCSCDVDVDAPLSFGAINPIAAQATDAAASLRVSCVSAVGLSTSNEIRLSTGGAGSFSPRRMSDGFGRTLAYNLYRDAARTQIWGDGTGGSTVYTTPTFFISVLNGYSYSITVYGRVPAAGLSGARAGTYSDTITVTVIF